MTFDSSFTALTIRSHENDNRIVLFLNGELDISSAPAFAGAIADTCARDPQECLLDIRALDFVDSTGLRAILAAKAACEQRSCRFAITEPLPAVKRLFEVTGVLDHLACQPTTDGQVTNAVQLWPPVESPAGDYASSAARKDTR